MLSEEEGERYIASEKQVSSNFSSSVLSAKQSGKRNVSLFKGKSNCKTIYFRLNSRKEVGMIKVK